MAKTSGEGSLCATPGCRGEVGERSVTGLCSPCYSYIYNNQKRTPRALILRAQKLKLFESRLSFLLPANTVIMQGKTKIKIKNETPPKLAVMPGHVKRYRRRNKYKKAAGAK